MQGRRLRHLMVVQVDVEVFHPCRRIFDTHARLSESETILTQSCRDACTNIEVVELTEPFSGAADRSLAT
jgi:hypothetical protein